MKTLTKTSLAALVGALFALLLSPAFAAHEANNYALLGSDDSAADGQALVNYVAGKDAWNGNIHVTGLPEGIYFFAVRFNAGETIGDPQDICHFEVGADGQGHCTARQFELGGFHEALVLDAEGNIVLSGFFERRGGKRAK